MKKAFLLLSVLLIGFFIGRASVDKDCNLYARSGVITEIDGENVYVEDLEGRIWVFDGMGYEVGDRLGMLMDDQGTYFDYEDDTIVWVRLEYREEKL